MGGPGGACYGTDCGYGNRTVAPAAAWTRDETSLSAARPSHRVDPRRKGLSPQADALTQAAGDP